jgi:hypothetical protein
MASRDNRSRKRARKARKLDDEEARKRADEAYAEERRLHPTTDFSQIRRILLTGSFRSHEKGGYQPFKNFAFGPSVKASNPEELEDATNEAYVEQTLGQVKN